MNNSLNVLIYGSGAREHALALKISKSPLIKKLYLAKPNDGFKNLGTEIFFKEYTDLAKKCKQLNIDIAIIGPEAPLAEGIVDILKESNISCIGPSKYWAQLESSKSFAKKFMNKYHIPTARYQVINNLIDAQKAIKQFSFPIVIKADGLCAGKGVSITQTKEDALDLIKEYLNGKFGEASKTIIIEECLKGQEISLFSIWDGKNLKSFAPCKDYKKLFDNDMGPNTGGMGSFCPILLKNKEQEQLLEYKKKLKTALINEKADFKGIIYSGLIITNSGIKVLEYNVRFGDPEVQSLMLHLKSDLLEVFKSAAEQKLDKQEFKYNENKSVCLVLSSKGYPNNPELNFEINNIENASNNVQIFYAGVKKENHKFITNGGRVLSICSCSNTARENVYSAAQAITFEGKHYRLDIGK